MVRATKNLWVGVAFAALAAATSPMAASAQGAGAEPTLSVSIPAQRLSDALRQLAEASHLQLIYDAKMTDGKTSPGVSGAMTSRAALAQVLAGSGLSFRFSGDRTVTIFPAAAAGVRAVGVVNVQGAGSDIPNGEMVSPVNGINGSTDVEATEGTGSYTTGAASIVSKAPQSLRETPQSVSVITQQRISDEGLQSLESVLDVLPGLTVTQGSINTEFQVYSRGFPVVSYAFDGGAPLNFGLGNRPVIDLSEFDSAQLIRGADGLFGGYGDPGGFVNLERKKPLDHDQVEYSQDIGSFSNYREEADATGPLTADGKLKGRIAVAQQDENFFYKVANTHKTSIYGILEYDFTPNLIVNVGVNYLTEKSITNGGGLPRYSNGAAIDWPVSTCLCEPYDYDKTQRREVFVGITYKFNNDLSTKFNFTYNNQQIDQIYWGLESTIAPGATPATATPANGQATAYLLGYLTENPNKSYSFDDATTGKFKVFGLEQQFVVGGNYVYYDLDGESTTDPSVMPFIPDVFQFNPSLYPEPAFDQPPDYTTPVNRETTYGVYGNAKLELIKGFHLMLGIRESGYSDKQNGVAYGFPFVTPPLKDTSHSSLNVGATYDIFKNFTLYASHESIYLPQSETRYTQGGNNTLPPPITGVNDEAGVKWQSTDKLLNASLAFFSSLENGLEQTNYADPGSNIPVIDNRKSSGLEFEVTGQMLPGLQGSFSFARAVTKDTTSYSSQPLTSFVPPNKIKSFAVYRPQGSGIWSHFLFGGGVDWQSSAYTLSSVCLDNPPSPFGCSNYAEVPLTAKAYATLKLKVGYRFNRNLELSADANNVTNVKAYSPLQFSSPTNYNFYTTPFNFLVSLRAKW